MLIEKYYKNGDFINDILNYLTQLWWGFKLKEDKDFEYLVPTEDIVEFSSPIFVIMDKRKQRKFYFLSLFSWIVIDLNVSNLTHGCIPINEILEFNFVYFNKIKEIWFSKETELEKFFNEVIFDKITISLNKYNKELKGFIYILPMRGKHGSKLKIYDVSKTKSATVILDNEPKIIGNMNLINEEMVSIIDNFGSIKIALGKIWKKSPSIKEINGAIETLKEIFSKM